MTHRSVLQLQHLTLVQNMVQLDAISSERKREHEQDDEYDNSTPVIPYGIQSTGSTWTFFFFWNPQQQHCTNLGITTPRCVHEGRKNSGPFCRSQRIKSYRYNNIQTSGLPPGKNGQRTNPHTRTQENKNRTLKEIPFFWCSIFRFLSFENASIWNLYQILICPNNAD